MSQERVSGFPEKGADLREVRELPGKFGELPGKFGKLPGNLWIAVSSSTVRELPGKSPKNFRGSSGTPETPKNSKSLRGPI